MSGGGVEGQIVEEFEVCVKHETSAVAIGQKAIELPLGSRQVFGVHILLRDYVFYIDVQREGGIYPKKIFQKTYLS